MAIAHGAGLILALIYLGLCRAADLDKGHEAAVAAIEMASVAAQLTRPAQPN